MTGDQVAVAPYAGAWIETTFAPSGSNRLGVAPYAGAWIETGKECYYQTPA